MVEGKDTEIGGRGGTTLTHLKTDESTGTELFYLIGGANRETQFLDVWKVFISPAEGTLRHKEKVQIEQFDGFTTRNGHSAVALNNKEILIFGGQDSE
jgi:hypothetical protein